MASDQTNFDMDQGTDFRLEIELLDSTNQPIDISTAIVVGQIRRTASSPDIETCFVFEPINLLLGKFAVSLSALVTAKLKVNSSPVAARTITQFAYDVEVHFSDGKVSRILSGVISVSPEVTR